MADSGETIAPRALTTLRVSVLGPFRIVDVRGQDLTPRSRKTRALAGYLMVHAQPVGRERLKALLWGDRGEDQASASLRQALYELRELAAEPAPRLAVTRESAGRVAPPDDLVRLEAAAASGDLAGLTGCLADAGELLADLDGVSEAFDDWLRSERPRWRDRIVALAVAAGEAANSPAEVRRLADRLEEVDPLSEPAVRLGLAADHALGDRSGLHRRYRRFEDRLAAELEAEPSAATRGLFQELTRTPTPAPAPATAQTVPPARRRRGLALAAVAAVVLASAGGYAAWRLRTPAAPVAAEPVAVAILPFRAVAAGADEAYLGAGVSDEIRNLLAANPKVRSVGARSAQLLAAEPDALAAARRLGLPYLVDGEIRPSGQRAQVTARFRRVADGKVMWSQTFDRPLDDIFAIQNEIAAAVAQQFGATLAKASSNPHLVTRPEVYDHVLAARSLAQQRRVAALEQARDHLKAATTLDPGYAPGLASLAQVTMLLADHPGSYGATPMPQAQAEARSHARRALELAPELADGYAAFGLLSLSDAESVPFYERAVALDPQRSDYHRWLAQSYMAVGRHRDALPELRRAAALEPLWYLPAEHLVDALYNFGHRDEANALIERFARISTDQRGIDRLRSHQLVDRADFGQLLISAEVIARQNPQDRQAQTDYAEWLALLGENAKAEALLPKGWVVGGPDPAGSALRAGPRFWDVGNGKWDGPARLVEAGRGEVLLKLYDQAYATPEAYERGQGMMAVQNAPSILVALQQAGRTAEVQALAARMLARIDSDQKQGVDPYFMAYDRAAIFAVLGRREEALRQLEYVGAGGWRYLAWTPYRPLGQRLPFRALADGPRLKALQAQLKAGVDAARAKAGLPPLKT